MKWVVWGALVAALGLGDVAWSQQWAANLFETKSHDFGTVAVGAKAEFAFVAKNNLDREVRIASVRSSCGCSDVRIENPTLQTYETGAVVASVNSERLRGRQASTITVVLDRPYRTEVQLRIEVFIRGDLLLNPSGIGFGDLSLGTPADQSLTVTRFGKPDWRILDAEIAHPHLTVEVQELERSRRQVSYRLKVELSDQTPTGSLSETVMLTTNDSAKERVPVLVEGRVLPEISAAPAALFWGVVPAGESATRQIVVRSQKPFRIVRAWTDCDCFQFMLPEEVLSKPVHLLPVSFEAGGPERGIRRVLRIETDGGQTVELVAHAAVKVP